MADQIRIVHGALDEGPGGSIIIRGVVHPDDLVHLQVAPYQREILPGASQVQLKKAILSGTRLPDIELGMRGDVVISEDDPSNGEVYILRDPTFIIDGLQRVSAAKLTMTEQGFRPHIGASIHLQTTEEWERERFRILNADRTRIASNVLLRNMRHDHPGVEILYNLTMADTTGFVLKDRVCWSQRKSRGEYLTAVTFAKVVARLHAHMGPGRSSRADLVVSGLDKIAANVGPRRFRANIKEFFAIVDKCFGLRNIAYIDKAPQLKQNFLITLAVFFMSYPQYFFDNEGRTLVVDRRDLSKLAKFPINDPHVKDLIGSGADAGRGILLSTLIDFMNSGRRTRKFAVTLDMTNEESDDNGDGTDDNNNHNHSDDE